jgi:hypothetical protein
MFKIGAIDLMPVFYQKKEGVVAVKFDIISFQRSSRKWKKSLTLVRKKKKKNDCLSSKTMGQEKINMLTKMWGK